MPMRKSFFFLKWQIELLSLIEIIYNVKKYTGTHIISQSRDWPCTLSRHYPTTPVKSKTFPTPLSHVVAWVAERVWYAASNSRAPSYITLGCDWMFWKYALFLAFHIAQVVVHHCSISSPADEKKLGSQVMSYDINNINLATLICKFYIYIVLMFFKLRWEWCEHQHYSLNIAN